MADYDIVYLTTETPLIWGAGGTGDLTPPVVTVVSPTAGSSISSTQAVVFDVTDNRGTVALNLIYVTTGGNNEVVFDDVFLSPYTSSARVAITNGFRYTVRRVPGWPSSPTFTVKPVDEAGNVS